MRSPQSRRRFLQLILTAAAATSSGCGSILYPERVGQPRRGPLDWKVVFMDGAWLVLFFLPGVVAFAVDWYNGAIFLPAGQCRVDSDSTGSLVRIEIGRGRMTEERIEAEILKHTGHSISLQDPSVRTQRLERLEQFDRTVAELTAGPLPVGSAPAILRAQSPNTSL